MSTRDRRIWIGRDTHAKLKKLSKRYHFSMRHVVGTLIDICIEHDLMKGFELELRDGILKTLLERNDIDLKEYMRLMDLPLEERSLDNTRG